MCKHDQHVSSTVRTKPWEDEIGYVIEDDARPRAMRLNLESRKGSQVVTKITFQHIQFRRTQGIQLWNDKHTLSELYVSLRVFLLSTCMSFLPVIGNKCQSSFYTPYYETDIDRYVCAFFSVLLLSACIKQYKRRRQENLMLFPSKMPEKQDLSHLL